MPTTKQAIKAVILCQYLSNTYQPINVFRYDIKQKTIYIQAGVLDEFAIIITEEGYKDSIFYRETFYSVNLSAEGHNYLEKGFPIKNKDIFREIGMSV